MEYVENFFIWAAEQFAIAYRRIGIQVIPRWNSLAYSYHMLLMLGSFFVMVLAMLLMRLAGVTIIEQKRRSHILDSIS